MPSDDQIFPEIPPELQRVRIGTTYDSSNGDIKSNMAFDLTKFSGGRFIVNDGKNETFAGSNCSLARISEYGASQYSAEAHATFWGAHASVGGALAREHSSAARNFEQNFWFCNVIKGASAELNISGMGDEIYAAFVDEFKIAYDRVVQATDVAEYFSAFQHFTETYGDSFVFRVYLYTGAYVKATVVSSASSTSSSSNVSASTSISVGPTFGGSASGNWRDGVRNQDSNAQVEVTGTVFPFTSPLLDWEKAVEDSLRQFVLSNDSRMEGDGNMDLVVPPALEVPLHAGSNEERPKPSVSDSAASEERDKHDEDEKNQSGMGDVSTREYRRHRRNRQRRKARGMNNRKTVMRAQLRRQNAQRFQGMSSPQVPQGSAMTGAPTIDPSSSNLGGFYPVAFETKKWIDVFPELLPHFQTDYISDSRIYITGIWMFFLTRLKFLQYLSFLRSIPQNMDANRQQDVDKFDSLCKEFRQLMMVQVTSDNFGEEQYHRMIDMFDFMLYTAAENNQFKSIKIYETFFNQYDLFNDNPYGFILTKYDDGKQKFLKKAEKEGDEDTLVEINGMGVGSMVAANAVRVYPAIDADGHLGMFVPTRGCATFPQPPSFNYLTRGTRTTGGCVPASEVGRLYTNDYFAWNVGLRGYDFIGVGFGDVTEHYDGVPYAKKLPFDDMLMGIPDIDFEPELAFDNPRTLADVPGEQTTEFWCNLFNHGPRSIDFKPVGNHPVKLSLPTENLERDGVEIQVTTSVYAITVEWGVNDAHEEYVVEPHHRAVFGFSKTNGWEQDGQVFAL